MSQTTTTADQIADVLAEPRQEQAVATVEADAVALPAQEVGPVKAASPTGSIVDRALELASVPGANVDILDRIIAWQERETAGQAEERFNEAMNRCQAEIEPVARTAENKQVGNFYAKLEAVDAAIRPIYIRHGFAVSYNTVPPLAPGNIRIECEVSLGRHSKKYYREAPADTLGPKGTPVKTVLHGGGSTETFLKRYAVTGAFNVVFRNLDDDGNKGGAQYIGDGQGGDERIETLTGLLENTKTNRQEFFRMMVTDEIFEVNEVQMKDYPRLVNALQRKQHQMANRKKPETAEGDAT